jgi:hypothetical protein
MDSPFIKNTTPNPGDTAVAHGLGDEECPHGQPSDEVTSQVDRPFAMLRDFVLYKCEPNVEEDRHVNKSPTSCATDHMQKSALTADVWVPRRPGVERYRRA